MNPIVSIASLLAPPLDEREILRYAGCGAPSRGAQAQGVEEVESLMRSCVQEALPALSYRACYCQVPVEVADGMCRFGSFAVRSAHLARNLAGCESAFLLAATVGVGIDRLILKYGRTAPSRALMMQAIGTERVEALCDALCDLLAQQAAGSAPGEPACGVRVRPRFSPGYGDVPLSVQKDLFSVLGCAKRIGVSLNDSLLMSPSKSVTAFMGVTARTGAVPASTTERGCVSCEKTDCSLRSES